MHQLFRGATSFNGDLSRWDVRLVTDMSYAFAGATSFHQRLGGAWSQSTANKEAMLHQTSGFIEGKVTTADGTPE